MNLHVITYEASFLWTLATFDENRFGFNHCPISCLKSWSIMWCGIFFGLFIPMLETLNSLVKFVQLHNVFICDLVTIMKLCRVDLHKLYVGLIVAFNDDVFQGFHGLVETNHDDICIKQIINLNTKIYHLRFEFNG